MTLEFASLPQTFAVKFAKYLIALRLSDMHKEDQLGRKYYDLAKKYYGEITPEELGSSGLAKFTFFNRMANSYGWLYSFRNDAKYNLKHRILENPDVPKDQVSALYQAMLFFFRPTNVEANIKSMQVTANKISSNFANEIISAGGAAKQSDEQHRTKIDSLFIRLEDVVKELTGKAGVKVPGDQLKKARLSNKAHLVGKYNALRREINAQYDIDLNQYVSSQPQPPLVQDAYKHMHDLGYDTQKIIKAEKKLDLRVGVTAGVIEYYTIDGRKIDGGIPADAIKVTLMSTYDPADGSGAYLHYTTPTAHGVTRKYTVAHKNKAVKEKFDKADAVAENIDRVVLKWNRDVAHKDIITAMCATVALIIYNTGMRVGTSVKSRSISGEKSYGALTMLVGQVTVRAKSLVFNYAGKKQVSQSYTMPIETKYDKVIHRNVQEFMLDKKKTDLLFSYETMSGKWKRLQPSELNAYLKKTGYPAGIHKIRHVRGTNLAVALLNKHRWTPNDRDRSLTARQRSAEEFIKDKILKPVAQLLGHKSKDGKDIWTTSISNYLNPLPFIEWFKEKGLRLPKWVPKNLTAA